MNIWHDPDGIEHLMEHNRIENLHHVWFADFDVENIKENNFSYLIPSEMIRKMMF